MNRVGWTFPELRRRRIDGPLLMQRAKRSLGALPAAMILVLLGVEREAPAHHSYAAEFDASNPQTIEGVVKEVWFKNPHIRYYVAVIDDDGNETLWDARGLSPVKLVRQGWTKKTIQPGDRIKLHGHVGHTNKTIMSILEITLPDGRVLSSRSVTYDLKDEQR